MAKNAGGLLHIVKTKIIHAVNNESEIGISLGSALLRAGPKFAGVISSDKKLRMKLVSLLRDSGSISVVDVIDSHGDECFILVRAGDVDKLEMREGWTLPGAAKEKPEKKMIPVRTCAKCGAAKPATLFSTTTTCTACVMLEKQERHRQQKEVRAANTVAPMPVMKLCKDCRISKPIELFSLNGSCSDGRHLYCKPCDSIRGKKNRDAAKAAAEAKKQSQLKQPDIKEQKMTAINSNVTAATLRQQAEALLKQAEEAELASSQSAILEDIRACQLDVARFTAIMSRLSGEMIDAMDGMEKASEALRKACAKR